MINILRDPRGQRSCLLHVLVLLGDVFILTYWTEALQELGLGPV